MKKRIISLVLLGISVLTVTVCAVLQAQSQRMVEKIIRLHVVANSDSNVDQAVKLCVRDAVLREAQRALSSAADAKQAILTDLPALEAAANAELQRQGSGDTARVSFRRELFPTRDYDTFSLPSGVYQSLRVTIGKGEGHNWWCIVFPPVCLSAVQSEQVEQAMSVEDYALITRQDGYELRFRTVELWGELLEKLEEHGWIAAGEE